MFKEFLHKLKGDRKYFAIVFFILFLFLLSGVVAPLLVENKKENWQTELTEKIVEIKSSVLSRYKERENSLLAIRNTFKNDLQKALSPGNVSYGSLIRLVNEKKYVDYSVEVFAPNGKLIAWNSTIAIRQDELFPLEAPYGETYFSRSKLITYLSVIDTVHLESDLFYIALSLPVEKHYTIQNPYYEDFSFSKEISGLFLTQFEVDYHSYAPISKDGREFSFEILNNAGNKIGIVTFVKPSLNTSIKMLNADITRIQSVFVVLGFFFLAFAFKKDFRQIKYRTAKLLIIIIYLCLFRLLLYSVNFPANILSGSLVDPAYFSSAFGWGIVKSPVEFFVSTLLVLVICITVYRYTINYVNSGEILKLKKYFVFIGALIPAGIFYFMTLRGLTASVRSVIFDSTLRYFKDPTLIPDLPSIVMNLNVFLLGSAVVLLLCSYIVLLFSTLPGSDLNKQKRKFIGLFFLFELLGILFIVLQSQPLLTVFIGSFFIFLTFALTYHILFIKVKSKFNYVYAALCSSIITITLLNFFNLSLEREALKTTALELNRPNDNLLRFLVSETLTSAVEDGRMVRLFSRENHNFDATAFRIWSHSSLQRESLNSSVVIYSRSLERLGSFEVGVDEDFNPIEYLSLPTEVEPEIEEIKLRNDAAKKYYAGIIPVVNNGVVLGFIASAVDIDVQNLVTSNMPEFLESKKNILSSVLDIRELKIFEFSENRLRNVYGDIYPSRDQVKPLVDIDFAGRDEAWTNISLNDETYITYLLLSDSDGSRKITAVALREKHFTWNLYNFFKIFIIHSIFILLLFIVIFIPNYSRFKYSFRVQLLIAFLFISILPVIVLAFYNRQIVTERSDAAVFNELNERSEYLENHVKAQQVKPTERELIKAFEHAAEELDISFVVFDGTEPIYNTKTQYYEAGLFENKLNPEAYYNLYYLSYREFFTKEKVENFQYDALYKRVNFNDKNYIIEVNDAFNKVNVTFSVLDVDIFLFGIYSFAVIIIIVLSTILANRISSPIRRLTKATESVAHGDLNVYLGNNEKGEIKDLLDGFNQMTQELKKNETELAELERESAWKEMAKQVAHEIKNPLTPMKLAVQQLTAAYRDKNRNFDEMFEKLSATILNQIESLSSIASEFSRFAKMPNLNLEVMNIIPVLHDTVNLFVDEKIKIEIHSAADEAIVEADKSQLRRMIINFIRNSIQAGASKIKFGILKEDNAFVILIEDNGKGIPDEVKDKIFESNFTTKAKGMGIGLKLAKRFLESIRGSIVLVSSSEEGTIFRITIPEKSAVIS